MQREVEQGYSDGKWTIVVEGGPAFMMNAALALKSVAMERNPGPMRDCLERLYAACEAAMPE